MHLYPSFSLQKWTHLRLLKIMQVGAVNQAPSPLLSLIEQIILLFRLVALKCMTHSSVLFFAVARTNTFAICFDHGSWTYDSFLRLLNYLLIERFFLGFVRSMPFRRMIHDPVSISVIE